MSAEMNENNIVIQKLHHVLFEKKGIELNVLRLDLIHPIVSGNKWFKLKYHLQEAIKQNKKGILTFGGAYSNHLVAVAFACNQYNLKSIGFVRGEEPRNYSTTLKDAVKYNMELKFLDRASYKHRHNIFLQLSENYPNYLIIDEGGKGELGIKGAAEISKWISNHFTHITCAVGTGTMIAGIAQALLIHQSIVGISSIKVVDELDSELTNFIKSNSAGKKIELFFNYHFGGYAKNNNELIRFMNQFFQDHSIPTDFVYTAKLFFGLVDLVKKDYFNKGDKIIAIHSGGLQGNRSLPTGTFVF